jgi:hypothetical protein
MSFDECKESARQEQHEVHQMSFDATQNLVGFFALLLEIDRRTNPERYRSE